MYNVGSIFRIADAIGVLKIFLCGISPTPIDRFGRQRKDFCKVSLGAEKTVAWQAYTNINDAIDELKKNDVQIVCVEQSQKAIDYKKYDPKEATAFVFGNEVEGIGEQILNKCDATIEIPMFGKKESLNVAVSAGIVLFRVLDR